MRGLGLIGLVVALAIVALVAKKQFAGAAAPVVSTGGDATTPATVRDQARQVQDQYKQALDAAMQQSQRKMPDDE